MSKGGRYVRAPEYYDSDDSEEYNNVDGNDEIKEQSDEDYASSINEVLENDDDDDHRPSDIDRRNTETRAGNENHDYLRRMETLQNQLNQLVQELGTHQPHASTKASTCSAVQGDDRSWNTGVDTPGPSTSTGCMRWENIQPFPNDVPANRMWEQWNRFIDRFEIATSVSNITDPAKRSQILFLSMGEKLQGITRAAKLRPSLREANCYEIFVRNIENYLKSMVDITTEYEAFCNLRQEPGESMMNFHARLMEKAQSCRFSGTEDMFVRLQLLKGMRNKDLARTARTLEYETAVIVQAATREEAYEANTTSSESPRAFAVGRERRASIGARLQGKRRYGASSDNQPQPKKQKEDESRYRGAGRRSRCPKCSRMYHKFGSCPAENRKCNACGKIGHFAVACWNSRKKSANSIHTQDDHVAGWTDEEEEKKVNA